MSSVEGGQKINNELYNNDVIQIQDGNKLIEFGRKQQSEAKKKLSEVSEKDTKLRVGYLKLAKL